MAIIGFLPARAGSKSIPNKNTKLLLGKPLIYWTLLSLEECSAIDTFIFASDGDELKEIASSFSFTKLQLYHRSLESASDTASTEQVILEYLSSHQHKEADIFVLLQATSPFTTSTHISEAIATYERSGVDSLLSCAKTKHFLWNKNGEALNYDFQNRPRRQDFEGNLQENGAIYISKVGSILKSKNRLSGKVGIYEMPAFTALEIDEPEDWIVAEQLMKKYRTDG